MPTPSLEEVRARVAARIREIATRKGLVLIHVADAAGVSRSQFWNVLRGDTAASLDVLTKIAGALNVDPVALVRPYRKPPAE